MSDSKSKFEDLHQWAATLSAIFTPIGVIAAMVYSSWSIHEVKIDRDLRKQEIQVQLQGQWELAKREREAVLQPLVTFEHEFWTSDATHDEDGIRIAYFPVKNTNLDTTAPLLRNHGEGPALEVKVKWIPKKIYTESGVRTDKDLLKKSEWFAIPSRIPAGESAIMLGLPGCLSSPLANEIKSIAGDVIIRYEATNRKESVTSFTFTISNNRDEKQLAFQFTRIPNPLDDRIW